MRRKGAKGKETRPEVRGLESRSKPDDYRASKLPKHTNTHTRTHKSPHPSWTQ